MRWTRGCVGRLLTAIGIVALHATVGCSGSGSDGPTPPANVATLKIVGARTIEDTAFASVPSVTIEYADAAGVKQGGVPLRFEILTDSATASVQFRPPNSLAFDATTDAAGRASASLAFLSKAGTGYVRVSAKGTTLADSVRVLVRPAKPFRIVVSPYDTAMFAGASVQLTARSLDRFGNVRADAFTWASSASEVSVSATGRATGAQFARATIRVSTNGVTDSSYLSVVPQGTIAASFMFEAPARLEIFDTDGSKRTAIPLVAAASCGATGLLWRASGDTIVFSAGTCNDQHVFKATLPGPQSRVVVASAAVTETWPSYSRDGQYIYFSAKPGHQNGEIWRMRADGSLPTRLGPAADFFALDQYPSVSNDGSTVVFSSNRKYQSTDRPTIAFLDVATGVVRESGLEGQAPRWSPQGDRIAFYSNSGRYAVANTDGSGVRLLSPSHYSTFQDPPSWSPDGRWIVTAAADPTSSAPAYGRLELINVQTGLVLPLAWTRYMTYPAWRP